MELRSRHLTTLKVAVDWRGLLDFGDTPTGRRRYAPVKGGRFDGDRLSGEVLAGGADWFVDRVDGAMLVDVRLPLRTHDGVAIALSYHGTMLAAPDAITRFRRGEPLGPDEYKLRTVARFDCGDARYAWLNDLLAVGVSGPSTADTQYFIHEIL